MVGLRDGLLELGYQENEHFVIGVRFTARNLAALPAAARELVQHGVDVIFTFSEDSPAQAARMATDRNPIVFSVGGRPRRAPPIQSFARPGGNITGVADYMARAGPETPGNVPGDGPGAEAGPVSPTMRTIPIQWRRRRCTGTPHVASEIELVAQARQRGRRPGNPDPGPEGRGGGDPAPNLRSLNIPGFILEAAVPAGIPTMFDGAFWVERGGLASYGPDYSNRAGRQHA